MTDRHPDRQTDKQNGMTIRLTVCERDAIVRCERGLMNAGSILAHCCKVSYTTS